MIGADVKFEAFFDRPKVMRAIDAKNRRVLVRTGAFGRRVMRGSIRPAGKKGRKSDPGQPPRYHVASGEGLRLIFYSYDSQADAVSIGPLKFRQGAAQRHGDRTIRTVPRGGKTVPQLLNEGGSAVQITQFASGDVVRRVARYRPRPFRDLSLPPTVQFFKKLMADEAFK